LATFHADSFFIGPVAACMQPAMANKPFITTREID